MLTSQVAHDILRLSKVDLLQQIAHLQLHILNHFANVGDMRRVILDSQIRFHLTHHIAGEVQTTERFGICTEGQDDGRSKFVVGCAGAVLGVEDVDTVPAARALGCGVDSYSG